MIRFELRNTDNILWRLHKDRAEVIADNQEASNPGAKGLNLTSSGAGQRDERGQQDRNIQETL